MKFEDSKYSNQFAYKKEVFSFGNLYLTKHFVISEMNEGIHVDYNIASELISRFSDVIKKGIKIGYIANRYNSYSTDPQLWMEFNSEYNFLVASAVVTYSDMSYLNASIEKHFFDKNMLRCTSLDEAIEWMSNLEVFKTEINRD